jgi:hypothetical protein
MRTRLVIICCLLLSACSPKEQLLRTNQVAKQEHVGRVYISAVNKIGDDPYKLGIGTEIESIVYKGESFKPKTDIVQLREGYYLFKAIWWRVIEETSMFILGTFIVRPQGYILKANGTYDISLHIRPGKTYVVDVASTVHHYNSVPDNLCVSEEDHDAEGVTYPAIGKTIRYPSKKATLAGCAELTMEEDKHNKAIIEKI